VEDVHRVGVGFVRDREEAARRVAEAEVAEVRRREEQELARVNAEREREEQGVDGESKAMGVAEEQPAGGEEAVSTGERSGEAGTSAATVAS
jgi:hypothetical protein